MNNDESRNTRKSILLVMKMVIEDWALNSSAIGLPNIFRQKNIFIKIIWILGFLGSVVYCIVWCAQNIPIYLQYQTYISSNLVQEIPTKFPAVSICNLKLTNKTNSLNFLNNTLFPNGNPIFKRAFYGGNDYVQNFVQFSVVYETTAIANLNDSIEQRKLGYNIDDMLLFCSFNWETCSANDFSYFRDPLFGNCFKYNSGTKANSSKSDYVKSAVPGPVFGLQLIIFLGNPIDQSIYELNSNGINVVVNNQTSFSLMLSKNIHASAGMETNIGVNGNFVYKLGDPYSDCLIDATSNSTFSKQSAYFDYIVNTLGVEYDQNYCYMLCLQDKIIQSCNCSLAVLPEYRHTKFCLNDTQEIPCAGKIASDFNKNENADSCLKVCRLPCTFIEYSTKTSSASYPNDYYKSLLMSHSKVIASNISFANLDKSVLKINVFYESMTYTVTQENAALTFMTFLSNVGGIFGLFIGVSILSLFEILDLISSIVTALINRNRSKKTQQDRK